MSSAASCYARAFPSSRGKTKQGKNSFSLKIKSKTMKTLSLALFVSLASIGMLSGQITPDFQIQHRDIPTRFIVEGDEAVYAFKTQESDNRNVSFYNASGELLFFVDLTDFPQFNTSFGNPVGYFHIGFLQRQLFDTDSEFEFVFMIGNGGAAYMAIVNEDGSILQAFDQSFLGSMSVLGTQPSIANTIDGTKMVVTTNPDDWQNENSFSTVYSLPGLRWVSCCTDLSMFNLAVPEPETKQQTTPFPNPTGADVTIPYALPAGAQIGMLELLDMGGQQVRSWQVGPAFSSIRADLSSLPSGTYITRLTAAGQLVESQKILLVK